MALTKTPIELSSTPGIVDNSNATAITIDSSENVGIGVSNPSDYYATNLVVTGPSEGGITIASTGNHTNYLLFADSTSGVARYAGMIEYAHSLDQMAFRTNSIQRMAIDSTGSIISSMAGGVFLKNSSGGTSATQILVSNTGGSMRAGVESSSGGAIQTGTSAYAAVFGNQSNYPTQFTTNGTVRATIDASGNFLVGKTSNTFSAPGFVANANGMAATRSGGACVQINRTSSDGNIQEFYKDGSIVGSISSAGGTISINSGNSLLYFQGDTYISGAAVATRNTGTIAYFKNSSNTGVYLTAGNAAWTGASDERLKTVSGEITGGIEKVKAMRPVNFTFNADSENKQRIGFIAQEMVSVVPEVVEVPETETDAITGDTSYWGIQYAEISVVLTAALKEAITKIETLEAKVQTLENN